MMQEQHHNFLYHMEMRGLGLPGEPNRLTIGTSRSENSDDTVRDQNDDNESSNKYQTRVNVEIGLIKYLKKDIKSCEKLLESQSQSLEEMHRQHLDKLAREWYDDMAWIFSRSLAVLRVERRCRSVRCSHIECIRLWLGGRRSEGHLGCERGREVVAKDSLELQMVLLWLIRACWRER